MAPDHAAGVDAPDAGMACRVLAIEEQLATIRDALTQVTTIAGDLACCVRALQDRRGRTPAPTEEVGDRVMYLYRHRN